MFNTDKKISAAKNGQPKKDINLLPDDLITARKKTPLLSLSQKTARAAFSSAKELHHPSTSKPSVVKKPSPVNFVQRLARLLTFGKNSSVSSVQISIKDKKTSAQDTVYNTSSAKRSSGVEKPLPAAAKPSANRMHKHSSATNSAVNQTAVTPAQDLVKLVAKQSNILTSSSAPSPVSSATRTTPTSDKQILHQIKEESMASAPGNEELDVNLLPHQKRHFTPNQIILSYLMVGIIALLAMIMPYINYYTKNSNLDLQLQSLHKQVNISQDKNKEVSQRATQLRPFWLKLQAIKALLPAHIYWSHLFMVLEKDTVANAYLTSLDVSGESKISLEGEAFKLRDVAEQLLVFQRDPQISHVELTSLNKLQKQTDNDAGYKFVFGLQLNPSFLYVEGAANNQ